VAGSVTVIDWNVLLRAVISNATIAGSGIGASCLGPISKAMTTAGTCARIIPTTSAVFP
jgi:hypothetical protein